MAWWRVAADCRQHKFASPVQLPSAPYLISPRCLALQDLLPAEIASSRRPGPAPMRPGSGGSPPRAQRTAAASRGSPPRVPAVPLHAAAGAALAAEPACSVDGVPDSVVDAWFREADLDGDGRVADSEARAFFLTSGLAPPDLSKVCWVHGFLLERATLHWAPTVF